ncbi:MAG TPA: trypsin-like serine protease [Solirubrobacterales bacterium]|nr:trypsin-like serine protease [Solirubrobacterales bacterium]
MNGRIFGYQPGEGPYSCSGTSLATTSGSTVLTAGHCLYEGGAWGRDLVFVPAYDHGRRPFGTFFALFAYAMPRWLAFENSNYDVGALRVAPLAGRTLAATVGALPWTSGRSRQAALAIFGYPAGGLEGEELRECESVGLGSDPHAVIPGTPTMPAPCAMGGGSSGGAWLLGGAIDGVTSYGYSGQPERLYSPYFGAAVAHFLSGLK